MYVTENIEQIPNSLKNIGEDRQETWHGPAMHQGGGYCVYIIAVNPQEEHIAS